MRPLPIRIRVTAAMALAMAVVLAALGWFLYARLESHLRTELDTSLRVRADDLAALVRGGGSLDPSGRGLIEPGESFAQLLGRDGRVVDATRPLRHAALLDARAIRRPTYVNRSSVPGLNEPARLLATPVSRGVLIVGATRQNNVETLAGFRDELLVAGPIALLLASLVGYFLVGLSLRPVEAMRRRAAEISAETPGERLPVPETRDELERLGSTLNEMLGRLEEGLQPPPHRALDHRVRAAGLASRPRRPRVLRDPSPCDRRRPIPSIAPPRGQVPPVVVQGLRGRRGRPLVHPRGTALPGLALGCPPARTVHPVQHGGAHPRRRALGLVGHALEWHRDGG